MKKIFLSAVALPIIILAGCKSTPDEARAFIDSYNASRPVAKALEHYQAKGETEWSKVYDGMAVTLTSLTQSATEYAYDEKGNMTTRPCYDFTSEYHDFVEALARYSVAIAVQDMQPESRDALISMMQDKGINMRIVGTIADIDAAAMQTLAVADTADLRLATDREMISTGFYIYNSQTVIDLSGTLGLPQSGFKINENYRFDTDGDSCTVIAELSFSRAGVSLYARNFGVDDNIEAVARYFESHPEAMYEQFGHFVVNVMESCIRTGQPVGKFYRSIGCRGVEIDLEDTDNHSKASFFVPLDALLAEKEKNQ